MCGRYSLVCIDDMGSRFRVSNPSFGFRSHFNIAPGSMMPVIVGRERNEAVMMTWGLVPHWVRDSKAARHLINARAETLAERPSFRSILKSRRCLVPASGFYEWKKDGAKKIPFYIRLRDEPVFAFAGLYDVWHTPAGEGYATYTIITTGPNDLVAPIHNRMPAILRREDEDRWVSSEALSAADLNAILAPYPHGGMEAYPVSPLVNNLNVDDERLIQPLPGL
jgi:putative SOS response-associated peptidase YedK